ncbi:hypothetical protein KC338_g266 [Hortaea werneckii]|nr:hypothetical protein KC338_g266 [Hortaea werneckii]
MLSGSGSSNGLNRTAVPGSGPLHALSCPGASPAIRATAGVAVAVSFASKFPGGESTDHGTCDADPDTLPSRVERLVELLAPSFLGPGPGAGTGTRAVALVAVAATAGLWTTGYLGQVIVGTSVGRDGAGGVRSVIVTGLVAVKSAGITWMVCTYTSVSLRLDDLSAIGSVSLLDIAVVIAITATATVATPLALIVVAVLVVIVPAARRLGARPLVCVAVVVRHPCAVSPTLLLDAWIDFPPRVVGLVLVRPQHPLARQTLSLETVGTAAVVVEIRRFSFLLLRRLRDRFRLHRVRQNRPSRKDSSGQQHEGSGGSGSDDSDSKNSPATAFHATELKFRGKGFAGWRGGPAV